MTERKLSAGIKPRFVDETDPRDFEHVLRREVRSLEEGRKHVAGYPPSHTTEETDTDGGAFDARGRVRRLRPLGLALSGGGIRSATFNLGVLQSLARHGLLRHIDYLSSVSGGGYIACWLHTWIQRASAEAKSSDEGLAQVEQALPKVGTEEAKEVTWLRNYSNYLTPKSGMFGDATVAAFVWVTNALLNIVLLLLFIGTWMSLPWLFVRVPFLLGAHARSGLWCYGLVGLGSASLLLGATVGAYEATRRRPRKSGEANEDARAERQTESSRSESEGAAVEGVTPARWACGWLGLGAFLLAAPTVLPKWADLVAGYVSVIPGVALSVGLIAGRAISRRAADGGPSVATRSLRRTHRLLGALAAGGVLAGVVYGLSRRLGPDSSPVDPFALALALTVAFTALCAALSASMVLYLGISGRALPESARQWWRKASTYLAVGGAGTALFALVSLVGPFVVALGTDGQLLAAVAGWAAATGTGTLAQWKDKRGAWKGVIHVAPWLFLLGMLLAASALVYRTIDFVVDSRVEGLREVLVDWDAQGLSAAWGEFGDRVSTTMGKFEWWGFPLGWLAFGALITLLSRSLDINLFSLHMFYRSRLERGFLGASRREHARRNWVDLDADDAPRLDALKRVESTSDDEESWPLTQRPYPILNAAINLTRVRNLAWSERKAASFTFTPDYCGYELPRNERLSSRGCFQPTSAYVASIEGSMSLGVPMTVSGAAVNPNSATIRSTAVAALMTVFNFRLGWWLQNPSRTDVWQMPGPMFSLLYLLKELVRRSDETGRFVHLSDGAHFDNLGLYELVRRRCRYIIVSDAGRDPDGTLDDLANAVRRCRVDLGAEITIDAQPLRLDPQTGRSKAHCVAGTIDYPSADDDPERGYLVVLKSSLTGDEPRDVMGYAAEHPSFPHQSTSDQWFTESQFESYRRLGLHAADAMLAGTVQQRAAEAAERRPLRDHVIAHVRPRLHGGAAAGHEGEHAVTAQGTTAASVGTKTTPGLPADARWDPASRALRDLEGLFNHLAEEWRFQGDREATGELLMRLEKLLPAGRGELGLLALDQEFYPEWAHIVLGGAQPQQPASLGRIEDEDRAVFRFCGSLISFMEAAYHELKLDLDDRHDHPECRGWMNLFRHWSGSRSFRITWAVVMANHGAAFQRFCERHFGLSLRRVILGHWLKVADMSLSGGQAGDDNDCPNGYERAQLARLLEYFERPALRALRNRLYAVPLQVRVPLLEGHGHDPDFTVGMAVLTHGAEDDFQHGPTLRYFRIRDQFRKVGLGRQGMEALWRLDCRLRVAPRLQGLEPWIPESDWNALLRLWRSVKAVVPHYPIIKGEELLDKARDPDSLKGEQPFDVLNEAERWFERALQSQPENEDALRGLARVWAHRDELEQSQQAHSPAHVAHVDVDAVFFEDDHPALEARPGDSLVYYKASLSTTPKPDRSDRPLDHAIELLEKIIDDNDCAHHARYNLGCLLVQRSGVGDAERAIREVTLALIQCPALLHVFERDPDLAPVRPAVRVWYEAEARRRSEPVPRSDAVG